MKKVILIFTLTFILLNVLVCGAHADVTAIPQRVEIIGPKMTANPSPLLQRTKTYLYVRIKPGPYVQVQHYVCSYVDEVSKAWFEMILLAWINQKEITIIYDPDYETTFTLCANYNSDGSCATTSTQPITARIILGVYFE